LRSERSWALFRISPIFQPARRAKLAQQPLLKRHLVRLVNNRLALLQRHQEMPVLLQFPLRCFPPLLPVVADDVRHQHLLNLVRGCLAAVAVQHEFHQFQVVGGRQLAQALQIGRFPREDVFLRDRLERLRRERKIHRMPGLARKIDGEPRKHCVHCLDSSEAPAPVHAESTGGQLHERIDVAAFDLSSRSQFFKFLSHNHVATRVLVWNRR